MSELMGRIATRNPQEALATLTPIQDEPQLGDQARWWLGRASVGLAAANPGAVQTHLNNAISHLKTGADRAAQRVAQEPAAKGLSPPPPSLPVISQLIVLAADIS